MSCNEGRFGENVIIRKVEHEDIPSIVSVHLRSFQYFFLTFLGKRFVAHLYREILREPDHVFLVAVYGDKRVIGFAAGVRDLKALFTRLAKREWFPFALSSIHAALLRPSIIPRLWRALRYPEKVMKAACPASLMSIAVDPTVQGGGVGKHLVSEFLGEMTLKGVDRVCLTTDRDNNEAANNFYLHLGFVKVRDFQTEEGRWMCEYVIEMQPRS
jgi:ribosomal protein S18 acetylase RimI-like enzyme